LPGSGSDVLVDRAVVLTARQEQVLALVVQGRQNQDIAKELGVSEVAVKRLVSRMLVRFQVPNRAALANATATRNILGTHPAEPRVLSYLFRRSPIAIAIFRGPRYTIEHANDAFIRLAGSRPLIGLPARHAFLGPGTRRFFEIADLVFQSGVAHTEVEFAIRWDGLESGELADRYSGFILEPIRAPDGKVDHLIAFVADYTTDVRKRRQLEELDEKRFAALESLPVGVAIVDRSLRIVFANTAVRQALAAVRDPLQPAPTLTDALALLEISDKTTSHRLTLDQTVVARCLATGTPQESEHVIRDPQTHREVSVRVVAAPFGDGRPVNAVIVVLLVRTA